MGIVKDADVDAVLAEDAKVAGVGRTRAGAAFMLAATDRSTLTPGYTSMTWTSLEGG